MAMLAAAAVGMAVAAGRVAVVIMRVRWMAHHSSEV
jgi:hypothetical protein